MTGTGKVDGRLEREARLRWVPLTQMRVNPLAQRDINQARVSRLAMVASGTRNAPAISAVLRPHTQRSVSATRASRARAGWQHMKMSPSASPAAPPRLSEP